MLQWIARAGLKMILAQLVAWGTFGASLALVGLPLWIPSPVTLFALALAKR